VPILLSLGLFSLVIVFAAIAILSCIGASSVAATQQSEAYAVANGNTLTFYYDSSSDTRLGSKWEVGTGSKLDDDAIAALFASANNDAPADLEDGMSQSEIEDLIDMIPELGDDAALWHWQQLKELVQSPAMMHSAD